VSSRTTAAAGGVVWRYNSEGVLEIAAIHRPRYDDWSLPKGKALPDESLLAAAVREVAEELGARVAVSRRLSDISYRIAAGRKTVSFWTMRFLGAVPTADDEVDEVEWLTPKAARKRLTYDLDRRVVSEFAAVPVPDSVLVVVRHARAGKRSEWRGDDEERPLDLSGERQARRLVPFLSAFGADHIYSAPPRRCVETVTPVARKLGLDIQTRPEFSDAGYASLPTDAEFALRSLVKPGSVSVVCSQGRAIPGLVAAMVPGIASAETRKGAAWVLSFVDGTAVSADYYDDPC
jgi:8-oxo-dGTP diphosphatase